MTTPRLLSLLTLLLSGAAHAEGSATGDDLRKLVAKAGYVHQDCWEINRTDGVHCGQFTGKAATVQTKLTKAALALGWKQVGTWKLNGGDKTTPYATFKKGSPKGTDTILIQITEGKPLLPWNWFKISWAD